MVGQFKYPYRSISIPTGWAGMTLERLATFAGKYSCSGGIALAIRNFDSSRVFNAIYPWPSLL